MRLNATLLFLGALIGLGIALIPQAETISCDQIVLQAQRLCYQDCKEMLK